MFIPSAFSLENALPFGAVGGVWLRLEPLLGVTSIAQLPWRRAFAQFAPVVKLWRTVVVAESNAAVKRTGLQPAAYFIR